MHGLFVDVAGDGSRHLLALRYRISLPVATRPSIEMKGMRGMHEDDGVVMPCWWGT